VRLSLITLSFAAVSLACDGRPLPGPEAPGALQALVEGSPGDFGEWGIPVHLGPAVNTTFAESAPALARKGLSLYFQSNRNGTLDLWVSATEQRGVVDDDPSRDAGCTAAGTRDGGRAALTPNKRLKLAARVD
jgi:hypothetical protein